MSHKAKDGYSHAVSICALQALLSCTAGAVIRPVLSSIKTNISNNYLAIVTCVLVQCGRRSPELELII